MRVLQRSRMSILRTLNMNIIHAYIYIYIYTPLNCSLLQMVCKRRSEWPSVHNRAYEIVQAIQKPFHFCNPPISSLDRSCGRFGTFFYSLFEDILGNITFPWFFHEFGSGVANSFREKLWGMQRAADATSCVTKKSSSTKAFLARSSSPIRPRSARR